MGGSRDGLAHRHQLETNDVRAVLASLVDVAEEVDQAELPTTTLAWEGEPGDLPRGVLGVQDDEVVPLGEARPVTINHAELGQVLLTDAVQEKS